MAKKILITEYASEDLLEATNGPCNDPALLNQCNFYEKPGSKVLNIKLVGPGLAVLQAISSPIADTALQKTGNTLVFGDSMAGIIYKIYKTLLRNISVNMG